MKRMLLIGGLACTFVVVLWLVSFFIVRAAWTVAENGATELNYYAQFGDSFGAINALFSGFAFAGIIVALILQREDIDASIRAQRDSADAQKEAALQQRRQATISAMAAALEAKKVMLVYWEELRKQQLAAQSIKNRPRGPDEEIKDIKEQMCQISSLLDEELKQLIPIYVP